MNDIAPQLTFRGLFEPLIDQAYFARVIVGPDLGTVVWPNGADLDSDVRYTAATGESIMEVPETQYVES